MLNCPRLDHFVRFNPKGTVSRCGHMVDPPEFNNLSEMDSSEWLATIRQQDWPVECRRCQQTESISGTSIRLNSIEFDKCQTRDDYLIVGGVLDNICNSACLTCNEQLSTKIGGLISNKHYKIVDNTKGFWSLPQERIVHLDINGGEPSYSKNYRHILSNLPNNVKSIRLNTNCSKVLYELNELHQRGIHVTVTVSLDGIGSCHDFVRWPIKWDNFYKNLMIYKSMPIKLNTWTTVSALNIDDLSNIIAFTQKHGLDHSYAYLTTPSELAVENKGTPQSLAYIQEQKKLRGLE